MTDSAAYPRSIDYTPSRGISYYLIRLTALLVLAGIPVLAASLASGDYRAVEFYFDYLSTPFLIACALAEVYLSHRAVQIFAPGEPLRRAWQVIRAAAVFHSTGLVLWHVLGSDLVWNPLMHAASPWNEQTAKLLRDAGYVLSGMLRMAVLAVGLGLVVRTMNRLLRPRLTFFDYALIVPVCLFGCYQAFIFSTRLIEAREPENFASLTDGGNNPLLTLLLVQALIIYRSLREMGGGLIARCWGAFAVGIVLTCLGTLGLWAQDTGYLPWPYFSAVWYVWLPAAAAYALAPAYQLEAAWALRVVHLKAERGSKREPAADRRPFEKLGSVGDEGPAAAAKAAWEETLSRVPTLLRKLVLVSSCRTGNADYSHAELGHISPEIASHVLHDSHYRLFACWLELGVERQFKDFVEYLAPLSDAEQHRAFLKDEWQDIVPPSATEADVLLFETYLDIVLTLTKGGD